MHWGPTHGLYSQRRRRSSFQRSRCWKLQNRVNLPYIGFYGVSCSMYRGYPSTNVEVKQVNNTVISSDPVDRKKSVCYLPVFNISKCETRNNRDIRKFRILRFFCKQGVNWTCYYKNTVCKENINIHTVEIPANQMSPYLSCSNMGKWYCNET